MRRGLWIWLMAVLVFYAGACSSSPPSPPAAEEPPPAAAAAPSSNGGEENGAAHPPPSDDLQRAIRINNYSVVADHGPGRGEVLYFYKCWMCHNKYTVALNPGYAKDLQGFYKSGAMKSGEPVNDATMTAVIKDGNSNMPGFGPTMSDADISDLLSYLKSDTCCHDGENPPPNPWYRASASKWPVPTAVSGGATGSVRSDVAGDSPEGIKVQLIAPNGVRTTVYTNEEGAFEFPKMQTGEYTLRIATPLEFKPYRRDRVRVDGSTRLEPIALERLVEFKPLMNRQISEALPATPDVEAQMSGAEILWNLPGTLEEKDTLRRACGSGCHGYAQIFRNRYSERSWALIVDRMFNYSAAPLLTRGQGPSGRGSKEDEQRLVRWLAKVRGPGAVDAPVNVFPRPQGASTRLVVTEYELPRQLLTGHDVAGDSKGNIWYTSHRGRFFGKLDPRTGVVTEYTTPPVPDKLAGTHRVIVDFKHNDRIWLSEPWGGKLTRFDPNTKELKQFPLTVGFNFGMAPDGSIWGTGSQGLVKVDQDTGEIVAKYDMHGRSTYDNMVTEDGNYWIGGGPSTGGNYAEFLDIRTGKMTLLDMGARMPGPSRGGVDPFGNGWFGGKNAALIQVDTKAARMREHRPPTGNSPYTDFYEAMPDKNGEVWGALLHGRGFVRYNPRTDRWVEYVLPEPFGHDRRTWIDNTTTPVTVWYIDYQGYIVRLQPLD